VSVTANAATAADEFRLTLAGRVFRPATPRRLAQEIYWDLHLRKAGVTAAPTDLATWDALVEQLLETDQLQYLVACCLVEAGTTWTRATADANAAFFWDLTDPDAIAQLQGVIGGVLLRFFPTGSASAPTSPSSSTPDDLATDPTAATVTTGQPTSPDSRTDSVETLPSGTPTSALSASAAGATA
jgi:hypothetical protein